MIPSFTAEAALPPAQGFYRAHARAAANSAWVTPQDLRNQLPDNGGNALGVTMTPCTCPCCQLHSCGLFGWSTCMTCC
jgi:hypothetical protein